MNADPDFSARRCSALLRKALGGEFPSQIRSIGRGGDYRNLARAAVSLRAGRGPAFELVHAWDLRSFVAALFSSLPTVFSPSEPLTSRAARWLRLAAPRHSVHLVAATAAQRQVWIRWGASPQRCHLVHPAIEGVETVRRDTQLRERLGAGDDDYVVLAPDESSPAGEHWRAVWAVSILHVLDQRYRILLWGRGREVKRARHLAHRLGQERLLILAEGKLGRVIEFEELLPAMDAALVPARGNVPMLPMLTCMAAGVPLVATQSPTVAELLRPDETALVVSGGAPREMARAILRLREQPALARKLAGAASVDVAARFNPARYVEAMRRVCWSAGMSGGLTPGTQSSAASQAGNAWLQSQIQ